LAGERPDGDSDLSPAASAVVESSALVCGATAATFAEGAGDDRPAAGVDFVGLLSPAAVDPAATEAGGCDGAAIESLAGASPAAAGPEADASERILAAAFAEAPVEDLEAPIAAASADSAGSAVASAAAEE
jgi:hypothetical protein